MAVRAQPTGEDSNLCLIKEGNFLANDGPKNFCPIRQEVCVHKAMLVPGYSTGCVKNKHVYSILC